MNSIPSSPLKLLSCPIGNPTMPESRCSQALLRLLFLFCSPAFQGTQPSSVFLPFLQLILCLHRSFVFVLVPLIWNITELVLGHHIPFEFALISTVVSIWSWLCIPYFALLFSNLLSPQLSCQHLHLPWHCLPLSYYSVYCYLPLSFCFTFT